MQAEWHLPLAQAAHAHGGCESRQGLWGDGSFPSRAFVHSNQNQQKNPQNAEHLGAGAQALQTLAWPCFENLDACRRAGLIFE